jgi:hypothetical protein
MRSHCSSVSRMPTSGQDSARIDRQGTLPRRGCAAGSHAGCSLERVVGANPAPVLLREGVVSECLLERRFHQLGGPGNVCRRNFGTSGVPRRLWSAVLQQDQAVSSGRNALRQACGQTTLASSSSRQYGSGCALMSPCPRNLRCLIGDISNRFDPNWLLTHFSLYPIAIRRVGKISK